MVSLSQVQTNRTLLNIYELMLKLFGARRWWPGETDFEICVGAILTQSVSWKNVTKAIDNLKKFGLLDLTMMSICQVEQIEKCIIPTMYFRSKAKKLKAFVSHVNEKYNGDLQAMFNCSIVELRQELLNIYGIGPETADSIILYAARKPVFVVDAYTKRIFSRIGLFAEKITYDEMQRFFMVHLSSDLTLYNEFHALIVGIGNSFCRTKKPNCLQCPLQKLCNYSLRS